MTSKYSIANDLVADIDARAKDANLDTADVFEASLIVLIQAFKESKGTDYARGILQYEMDSLGTSSYDIARGGGHS